MGKIIQSIFIAFILSGCSVFMAATGSDPVDLSKIQVGAHRSVVESQLGKPITFYRNPGGDYAVYQIITGVEPDYKRAAAYAVLTGLTLGLTRRTE